MDLNTLTVFTQDGDRHFTLREGGYCLQDGNITLAVSCDPVPGTEGPPCVLLCLDAYPIESPPKLGDRYSQVGGIDRFDRPPPRASAYFGFHVDRVEQTWEILAVDGDSIEVSVTAVTEDVNYYDERAKDTETKGRFHLSPAALNDLWIPS